MDLVTMKFYHMTIELSTYYNGLLQITLGHSDNDINRILRWLWNILNPLDKKVLKHTPKIILPISSTFLVTYFNERPTLRPIVEREYGYERSRKGGEGE